MRRDDIDEPGLLALAASKRSEYSGRELRFALLRWKHAHTQQAASDQ